jgi:chromosome segregation ATPase
MTLPEFAQLEEDNECLRAQLEDLENEKDDEIAALKAQINELKAQLHAKEEFATVHRQTEKRDGWVRGDDMSDKRQEAGRPADQGRARGGLQGGVGHARRRPDEALRDRRQ